MPSPRTLHAIGNAHIDPVWLWRWPEGLETIRSTFRSALDGMNEYPDFVFTCSSSAFLEMLELVEPDMLEEIAQRVTEGRWEIVGGWWVEPDTNVPSGEALIRQGLYGQLYLRQRFGRIATVGYNPDTFGHPASLPQILRLLGLTRYVFMRPGSHEKDLPGHVFRWVGPDGSEVLALRIARSYATWPNELYDHVRACIREAPPYLSDYVVFYGVGNHGGGPTRANIESLSRMAAEDAFTVRLSTLGQFFARVEDEMAAGAVIPAVADELQHHARGCYTAHSGIKRSNRRTEHLLMTAERLASVAHMAFGHPYAADDLTNGWKALLFTQFHDILAGTSLPEAYEDARDAHGYAAHLASRVLYASLHVIARHADTDGEGNAVVVFNPLPWRVQVPVEIERGGTALVDRDGKPVMAQAIQPTTTSRQRRSCFVADLPALGFRVFHEREVSEPVASPRLLKHDGRSVVNDWWQLSVGDNSGMPHTLCDRMLGLQLLRPPGMALVVMEDPSDTWSHGVAAFRKEVGRFHSTAPPVLEEDGPVRISIRTRLAWNRSEVVHRVRVYREVPLIECELKVLWLERHAMLKLAVPTTLTEGEVWYDVPYGAVQRLQDGEEHPGQQWADITGRATDADGREHRVGLAVLNDGLYGFDAQEGELRMSLLRSPVYAHHDPAKLDPNLEYAWMDQGEHIFRYALLPHAGDWRDADIPRRAWEFNVRPLWVNEYSHSGAAGRTYSFLEASPASVIVPVCKRAEDGRGLIVRAVETAGRETQAHFTLHAGDRTVAWRCTLAPWKITSFRVRQDVSPPVEWVDALEQGVAGPPLDIL